MNICKFCRDDGCLACEGEIIRYEKEITRQIRDWKPLDEKMCGITETISRSLEPEAAKTFLMAVNMPPKLFCWENGDEADRQAFARIFGAAALEANFANGVTPEAMEEIYKKAERERVNQRLRRNPKIPKARAIWKT